MKNTIKSLLRKFPGLTKNRFYFHLQQYRQYRPCKIDLELTDRPDIVNAIDKDGIFILENFLDESSCSAIVEQLEGQFEALKKGQYKGPSNAASYGAFRLGRIDEYSELAKLHFFDNKFIENIAKSYVSKTAHSYRREADYKFQSGNFLQSDLPHFDDWRHRFKAFLYLTEVTEKNAPFVYYKGSHKPDKWKYRYHLEYEIDGENGRYGHFFSQEMRDLEKKYDFEETICTGKAGTLIFADFRGLHKGTTLQEGRRILLNNTFGISLTGF